MRPSSFKPSSEVPQHAAGARVVGGTFRSVDARRAMVSSDYDGEFASVGGRVYRSRIRGFEVDGIRISRVADLGAVWMRIGWRADTLAAAFMWGEQTRIGTTPFRFPRLGVPGPGTEVETFQDGPSHTLRLGIRGRALEALLADPRAEKTLAPYLRAGVHLPSAAPDLEWRLQLQMLRATRFAGDLAARGVDAPAALEVAAREVVGGFLAVLEPLTLDEPAAQAVPAQHRRLIERTLELLEADPGVPASVADVCRQLGVSERTLQRVFKARLGTGLRDYERQRRLRHVHGAILAEGDRHSITEIAMRYGFWHLGRFAGAYAEAFGCTPSETRRRAWSSPSEPAIAEEPADMR